jgi:hypothetical protein
MASCFALTAIDRGTQLWAPKIKKEAAFADY